ncbi:pol-like protein [Colletotrichum kahawae]|uniref:Pol-like protein n=1 Tax=Colletotrichum kahawae TaxID=34407 RepID=A0AAD9YMS4_COLKA|nr:pol-like protein [Colletotrichum kahawae]
MIDLLEGSVNDAMNAEINRWINEAVNLLTALNGLMSTDRATPTLLISSVPTLSIANTTI